MSTLCSFPDFAVLSKVCPHVFFDRMGSTFYHLGKDFCNKGMW